MASSEPALVAEVAVVGEDREEKLHLLLCGERHVLGRRGRKYPESQQRDEGQEPPANAEEDHRTVDQNRYDRWRNTRRPGRG